MNRTRFLIGVIFLLSISMTAASCAEGGGDPIEAAAVQPSPEATETAVPPTDLPPTKAPQIMAPTPSEPVDGRFDIGGYQLYLQCYGEGEPTVVLESAFTAPGDYWISVVQKVKGKTRVCRYDRAGLGRSDPSPKSPRSAADMVDDLHALLAAAGVSGPFVMAGHSLGGLINLIYADTYPGEVVGIVLVDSATSNAEELSQQMSEEFDYEPPEWGPFFEGGDVDLELSRAEAAEVTDLGDIPLVILSAAVPFNYPDFPEGYAVRDRELYTEAQMAYLDLSTNSRHAVVAHTWHGTIVNDGFIEVSGAILDVVAQVRGE